MEESLKKQANLRLLQRTCCQSNNSSNKTTKNTTISDILATATHAVLYEFDAAQQNWKKCQTEGSLFLVTAVGAASSPSTTDYSIIILNRNSTDNFQLQITANLQLQHQEPYLILRMPPPPPPSPAEQQQTTTTTAATVIWGIWFHSADERVAMYQVLQTVVATLKEQPVPAPAAMVPLDLQPARSASAPHPPPTTTTATLAAAVDAEATALAAVTLKSVLGIGTMDNNSANSTGAGGVVTDEAATAPAPPATAPPAPASAAAASSSVNTGAEPPTLDKKSLQLALLSLIQDDRFLDLLHSQYLRVARTRAKKNQQQQPPLGDASDTTS